MRNRAVLALLLFTAAACSRLPVTDEVTLEPSKYDDTMTVTVTRSFLLNAPDERIRSEVETARAAAVAGTDAWSVRFARLTTPYEERHTMEKTRGVLERVTRAARIPSDDLQHLLADTGITVDVLRGEGWRELRLIPPSTGRATREQREQFETTLDVWSRSVTRYFTAMHHLYRYLDERPHRAQVMFAALLEEKGPDDLPVAVSETEEQVLLDAVRHSMDEISERMDADAAQSVLFSEEADLVFNPFPGRMVVRAPADVLESEGFVRNGTEVTIERVNLLESLAGLEGKWISPDPLAASLRDQNVTSEQLAEAERSSTAIVSSSEVKHAIREQLVRPKMYSVRWRD